MSDVARGPVEMSVTPRRSRLGAVTVAGGRTLLSLLSVAVLAMTCYGWYFVGDVNSGVTTTNVFDTEPEAEPLDGAVDILLVGMDSRTDAQGNPLPREVLDKLHAGEAEGNLQTDTMILVHIPQDGTSATAISFPRDAWVELAGGYGSNRLNSAFRHAYNDTASTLRARGADTAEVEKQAETAGRKNLIATVEQLVGRPGMIDRYAEVNLASFYEVTNALGGIPVCLNEAVHEPLSGIDLSAGRQTVEGAQALAFVRQRHGLPRGDLDRIARQQAFLSGLARKVLSSEVLLNPARLSDVISAVQKSVVISEDWDLLQFANQMRGLSGGQIEFHTMPVTGDVRIGTAEVLGVDVAEVRAFVDGLVSDDSERGTGELPETVAGAENLTVDIYNASGEAELGRHTRTVLRGQGFGGQSHATVSPTATSLLSYAPDAADGVEALRTALGTDFPAEEDATLPSGHLSVRLGSDFSLPESATTDREPLLNRAHPYSSGQPRQADPSEGPETNGTETNGTGPSGSSSRGAGSSTSGDAGGQDDGSEGEAPITADGVPCVN
ncbi:LCP family protein [Saccharomonospora saliphila]|uniref:LCP family protein n=1 Tax=Saccharomonospora saliphila TaxID=369829 RepID=UPI000370E59B|nr:LCP family protein [Saccharomonospora saliphila]